MYSHAVNNQLFNFILPASHPSCTDSGQPFTLFPICTSVPEAEHDLTYGWIYPKLCF